MSILSFRALYNIHTCNISLCEFCCCWIWVVIFRTIMLHVYELEIHLLYRTCIAYDEGMLYYNVVCLWVGNTSVLQNLHCLWWGNVELLCCMILSKRYMYFTEPALPMMRGWEHTLQNLHTSEFYIITFLLFQILTSDTCKKVQNFETCSAGHNSLLVTLTLEVLGLWSQGFCCGCLQYMYSYHDYI